MLTLECKSTSQTYGKGGNRTKQLIISKDPETNQFEWFMSDGSQLKQRAFTRLPEKVHQAVQDFLDGKM